MTYARHRDCRLGLGLAVTLTLWAWGPSPGFAQAAQAAATTEGLARVSVDLGSGSLNAVLPFDEPFLLTGAAPTGVTRIAASWCEVPPDQAAALAALLSALRDPNHPFDRCPGGAAPQPLSPWAAASSGSPTTFSLFLPGRLEPNRNFLFVFTLTRPLSAADLQALEVRVRQVLDGQFRDFEASQPVSLSQGEFRQLQTAVNAALAGLPQPPRLTDPAVAGSVFDPASVPASGAPKWADAFQDVYDAQLNRRTVTDRLDRLVAAAVNRLQALAGDPGLAALQAGVQQLDGAARTNLEHLLPAEALTALGTFTTGDLGALKAAGEGTAPLGRDAAPATNDDPLDPDNLWTPADVALALRQLEATAGTLEQLTELTRTAPQVNPLASALADDSAALADCRVKLGAASSAVTDLTSALGRLEARLEDREAGLDALADFVRREAQERLPIVGTSTGSFDSRAKNHISADLGVLYAGDIGEVLPYVGANFYLRPVNRDVPLSQLGGFGRRFSFLLGLTTQSLAETEGSRMVREDLFGSQALVAGFGFRITDVLRVNAGALVYQENAANPLVDNLELTAAPFIAVSFDSDVRTLLGNFGNLFN